MSSVSLPCPSCSAPLILDEENAGQEVLCPGCDAHLKLPSTVSAKARPELLTPAPASVPSQPESTEASPSKSALPQSRSKSVEEERKRLAAAAAAAGAAHSFQPDEASLPKDHRPAVLPSKRTVPVAAADSAGVTDAENPASRPPLILPTKRLPGVPLDPNASAVPLQPMEPRDDVDIRATPLTGPSRFVRPVMSAAEEIPQETGTPTVAAETPKGPVPRGGYRLGGSRNLHFSPAPVADGDGEAATWGAQAETKAQAARGRRFASLAVIIAILSAGGVGFYMLRQIKIQQELTGSLASIDPGMIVKPAEDVMRNVENAKIVLKRFLEAESVEKLSAEVRHPEVTRPRMDRYYAAKPLKPRTIKSESQSWIEVRIGDAEFITGRIELDDFRTPSVALEIIPGSDPKMDWESYVNWAEMPWKDFLRTPPEEAMEYRVRASLDSRDQYYNYSFKGREKDLLCFKLEDPEKFGSCWAYCDKDSEAATQLLFNLKRSRQQGIANEEGKVVISCILKLRFPPEGMKTNQVMIEKFIHDNWVLP